MRRASFECRARRPIAELGGIASLYVHARTGAELVRVDNADENRVFAIAFRTLPTDSTGVAHILEHMVFCGSRHYPLRRAFSELLKGSVQTYLNASTFPDLTIFPVASGNTRDFRNLVDVYLDAVLHPLLTLEAFREEAWHLGSGPDGAPAISGVVYNEMKGHLAAPLAALDDASRRSLYPDTVYGRSYAGDPEEIPNLSYEALRAFHHRHYRPSNALIFLWGRGDLVEDLAQLDRDLSGFDRTEHTGGVPLQPSFDRPRWSRGTYPGTRSTPRRDGLVSINWMLPRLERSADRLASELLELALVRLPGARLGMALRESGLGEALAPSEHFSPHRQPAFSVGLRGIAPAAAPEIEGLVLDVLAEAMREGLGQGVLEAALNTLEFRLREGRPGPRPRGLGVLMDALPLWRHGHDPLAGLAAVEALRGLRVDLAGGAEPLLARVARDLLENRHRTTVVLEAEPAAGEAARVAEAGRAARLAAEGAAGVRREAAIRVGGTAPEPDDPEAGAALPRLQLEDLPRTVSGLGTEVRVAGQVRLLTTRIESAGIVYLDLAFDLRGLQSHLIDLVPVFGRALVGTGTAHHDLAALSQRVGAETGGIEPLCWAAPELERGAAAARLVLRGKALRERYPALLELMAQILTSARLGDRRRLRQIVREERARSEARLGTAGHQLVDLRLRAPLHPAAAIAERLEGLAQLAFLRRLAERVETNWSTLEADLLTLREALLTRSRLVVGLVADDPEAGLVQPLEHFIRRLPAGAGGEGDVPVPPRFSEGFRFPASVNFVGQVAELGSGGGGEAVAAPLRLLATSWLWDEVRVKGGAYGALCRHDRATGAVTLLSYRDPNVLATLEAYAGAGRFLRRGATRDAIHRSIVGSIGGNIRPIPPSEQGLVALQCWLTGRTDARRQREHEALLAAGRGDFLAAADALDEGLARGSVVVLGGAARLEEALARRPGLFRLADLG